MKKLDIYIYCSLFNVFFFLNLCFLHNIQQLPDLKNPRNMFSKSKKYVKYVKINFNFKIENRGKYFHSYPLWEPCEKMFNIFVYLEEKELDFKKNWISKE